MQYPDLWPWTIATACFVAAIAATIKAVDAQSALKNKQKAVKILEAEVARLKLLVNEKESSNSPSFTKPINYPPSGIV
jgi:hypothetical protein